MSRVRHGKTLLSSTPRDRPQHLSAVARYGYALAAVVVATLLRLGMNPFWGDKLPYLFFFPALAFVGWICGFWLGLFALLLSCFATAFYVLPPLHSFRVSSAEDVTGMMAFVAVGMLIVYLADGQRRAMTAVKEAAGALQQSEEQIAITLQSIGDAVIATDAEGKITFLNAVAETLTGWSQQDAFGKPSREVFCIINETTRAEVESPVERVIRDGKVVGLANHTLLIARDGTEWPIDDSGAPIKDAAGNLRGVVLVFRNVAEAREAAERLRQSEQQYRMLAEAVPHLVWITDPEGAVHYLNRQWTDYTGYAEEVIARGEWALITHPDDVSATVSAWTGALATGQPYEVEYRLRRQDGEYRWFLARGVPVREEQGEKIVRWFGTCTDVHDRKQAEERQRFLADLSERTRTLHDPDAILWEAISSTGAFLGVSRCTFIEVDEAAGTLTVRRDWTRDGALSLVGVYPTSAYSENVLSLLRAGQPLVVTDVQTEERLTPEDRAVFEEQGVRALLNLALVRDGRWVGTLAVNDTVPRQWTAEEIDLLEQVAERTWLARENARLWEELERDRAQQARVAEVLQRSLLVRASGLSFHGLEVFPYYEAATEEALIGGDIYDAFALDGGKIALVVGDATGKGLAAASDAADSKFTLRAYLRLDPDPVTALRRMNEHLFDRQRLDGRPDAALLCLAVAVLDKDTGAVTVCTAGMEPPLLLRSDTAAVEEIDGPGPVLGVLPRWDGKPYTVHLGAGDVLMLYTDGIAEARRGRRTGDFFGTEGAAQALRAALPLQALPLMAQAVVAGAKAHAGGTLGDDCCLLLARVPESGKG